MNKEKNMQKNILTPEEKDLASINKIITEVSSEYDKLWIKRNRSINSKFLLSFIFHLTCNKHKGYGVSLLELWDNYELQNISAPQKKIFAPSSICEARQKFPEEIFVALNKKLISKFSKNKIKLPALNKHRVFAVDGSRLNLPKELTTEGYKTCSEGAHSPQGLVSCIYNIDTQVVHDFCLDKTLNERTCALNHFNVLEEDDVVIFDRGYFSYILLHQCKANKIHPVFRLSVSLGNKAIQEFVSSKKTDSIVVYTPSDTIKYTIKRQGFDIKCSPIILRLIKYTINGQLYLYGTTLIGDEYDKSLFPKLYHRRWDIEELYKISKCLIEVEDFHSKTERGVKQEIYAHFVLINLARFFESASKIKYKNKSNNMKFNFKNCLNVIGKKIQTIIFKSKILFNKTIAKITNSIFQVRQRVRPMRKYQRISHKTFNKWVLNRSPYRS